MLSRQSKHAPPLLLSAAAVCLAAATAAMAQPAPGMPVARYGDDETPYPLYAGTFGGDPEWTPEALDGLARQFDALYGNFDISREQADAVRSIKPDFQFAKYRGTWRTNSFGSAKTIEEKYRDRIQYYRVGDLAKALNEQSATVELSDMFGSLVASTAAPGRPSSYFENGECKFVSWIEIGGEFMRLESANGAKAAVARGFAGSPPAAHAAGTPVLAPVYSTPPVPGMREEVCYRADPADSLRWETLLADASEQYAKNGGGIWIDILTGYLSQQAMSGENVSRSPRLWNRRENQPYDKLAWELYAEEGIHAIQEGFRQAHGRYPVIWGNNLLHPLDPAAPDLRMLQATAQKPRPIDAFAQENCYFGYGSGGESGSDFSWVSAERWRVNLQSIMLMGELMVAAAPLSGDGGKDNSTFAKQSREFRNQVLFFSYASYLMAVHVEPDGRIYTKLGLCPVAEDESGKRSLEIPEFLRWPIGRPAETLRSAECDGYRMSGSDVWARRFEHGLVLVNPRDSETPARVEFGRTYLDIDPLTGEARKVESIEMPAKTGRIVFDPEKWNRPRPGR